MKLVLCRSGFSREGALDITVSIAAKAVPTGQVKFQTECNTALVQKYFIHGKGENSGSINNRRLSQAEETAPHNLVCHIRSFISGAVLGKFKFQDASTIVFLLIFPMLLYVVWLRSRIRRVESELARIRRAEDEQAKPLAKAVIPPEKNSGGKLFTIFISRAIPAFLIANALHDFIFGAVLGMLCAAGVLMGITNIRSKPAYGLSHLVRAASYGIAAVIVYVGISNDRSQVDTVVAKLGEYKRLHGDYPERLDALVPALLPEIPKVGLMKFIYAKEQNSYRLSYRPSVAGPCSYTPERGKWKCQAR